MCKVTYKKRGSEKGLGRNALLSREKGVRDERKEKGGINK
jgi:hypothetical protein